MTPRWAAVHASRLPAGAQVWISAKVDAAWTPAEHLAAREADLLAVANWQRSGKGEAPEPMKRPGDETRAVQERQRMQDRARRFRKRAGGVS